MVAVLTAPTNKPKETEATHNKRGPWRSADLELLPDNGTRYEIINGELFMAKSPHWHHQAASSNVCTELVLWSRQTGLGEAVMNPGVIFSEADDVIPDVVWVSSERLALLMDNAGHLTGAPDLAVEVLSFGLRNEERDRTAKRRLYGTQGVREYWILDWRLQQIEVYRREYGELQLVITLLKEDTLTSPLLPGFSCPVERIFH